MISGVVLDSSGNPIANANVWTKGVGAMLTNKSKAFAKSNAGGEFRIDNANPDSLFAFVEHQDYRFTGFSIRESDNSNIKVQLRTKTAPCSDRPLEFTGPTTEDRNRMHLELLRPMLRAADKQQYAQAILCDAVSRLAQTNPEVAASEVSNLSNDLHKARALLAMSETDDAMDLLRTADQPRRSFFLITSALLKQTNAAVIETLIAEANANLERIEDPSTRLIYASTLIIDCRQAGRDDYADSLVEKHLELARSPGITEFAKGKIAVAIAAKHPDLALQLNESVKSQMARNSLGSVIFWQVAKDPELAQRFLDASSSPDNAAHYISRMAYRMSSVDLEAALKLARGSNDRYGGQNNAIALGRIAYGIGSSNPDRSKQIMREAFEGMAKAQTTYQSFGAALCLLSQAVDINNESTGEYFWRTLSRQNQRESLASKDPIAVRENNRGEIAILLNQYGMFPEIEKRLVEPIFQRWEANTDPNLDYRDHLKAYVAMTLHDPERAIKWYHDVWLNESPEDAARPDAPWHLMSRLIRSEKMERAKIINSKVYHSWNVGNPSERERD